MKTPYGTGALRLVDEKRVVKYAQIEFDKIYYDDWTVFDVDVAKGQELQRFDTEGAIKTLDNGRFV